MQSNDVHVVTGAYGFSGKYIAKRLLEAGCRVRTLTNSIGRENPFGDRVKAYPFNFQDKDKMIESLQGGTVLYNNYWVRFNYTDHASWYCQLFCVNLIKGQIGPHLTYRV